MGLEVALSVIFKGSGSLGLDPWGSSSARARKKLSVFHLCAHLFPFFVLSRWHLKN